jgi:hypothetical protein
MSKDNLTGLSILPFKGQTGRRCYQLRRPLVKEDGHNSKEENK